MSFCNTFQGLRDRVPAATPAILQGWAGGWAARYVPAAFYGCIPFIVKPADIRLAFEERVRGHASSIHAPKHAIVNVQAATGRT